MPPANRIAHQRPPLGVQKFPTRAVVHFEFRLLFVVACAPSRDVACHWCRLFGGHPAPRTEDVRIGTIASGTVATITFSDTDVSTSVDEYVVRLGVPQAFARVRVVAAARLTRCHSVRVHR